MQDDRIASLWNEGENWDMTQEDQEDLRALLVTKKRIRTHLERVSERTTRGTKLKMTNRIRSTTKAVWRNVLVVKSVWRVANRMIQKQSLLSADETNIDAHNDQLHTLTSKCKHPLLMHTQQSVDILLASPEHIKELPGVHNAEREGVGV